MYRIFGDIPQCLNQRDDILIGASNWKKHNETLESVFQKAEDYGITLNEPKCEFGPETNHFLWLPIWPGWFKTYTGHP